MTERNENKESSKEIMNFNDVCHFLGICRNTLTKMMEKREIKFCKLGTQYKFRRSDILDLFDYNK